MLLRRGVFAGALFAGALFGAAPSPDVAVEPESTGGRGIDYEAHHRELEALRREAEEVEIAQAASMVLTYLIEERLI